MQDPGIHDPTAVMGWTGRWFKDQALQKKDPIEANIGDWPEITGPWSGRLRVNFMNSVEIADLMRRASPGTQTAFMTLRGIEEYAATTVREHADYMGWDDATIQDQIKKLGDVVHRTRLGNRSHLQLRPPFLSLKSDTERDVFACLWNPGYSSLTSAAMLGYLLNQSPLDEGLVSKHIPRSRPNVQRDALDRLEQMKVLRESSVGEWQAGPTAERVALRLLWEARPLAPHYHEQRQYCPDDHGIDPDTVPATYDPPGTARSRYQTAGKKLVREALALLPDHAPLLLEMFHEQIWSHPGEAGWGDWRIGQEALATKRTSRSHS